MITKDKQVLQTLLEHGADLDTIASTLGISRSQVEAAIKKYALERVHKKEKLASIADKLFEFLKRAKVASADTMAAKLNLTKHEIYEGLETLESRDVQVEKTRTGWMISESPKELTYNYKPTPGEWIGFVSDSHLGSHQQQLTHLNSTYDWFVSNAVKTVYHLGDVFDGNGMYRGQHWEQFAQGFDDQLQYGVKYYPKRPGIVTKIIAGNHDQSFYKINQSDIVKEFCHRRPDDTEYLGRDAATVNFGKLKFYLVHPKGGMSYAKSYRPQKFIEGLATEYKPNVILFGHWHGYVNFPARNVEALMVPCFQSQTSFLKTLGLEPLIGAVMIKFDEVDLSGTVKDWGLRRRTYFVPRTHDY